MSTATHDSTERRCAAHERMALGEARLDEAQRIAQIGNWESDIVNKDDWWSDELYRMLQVDRTTQTPGGRCA